MVGITGLFPFYLVNYFVKKTASLAVLIIALFLPITSFAVPIADFNATFNVYALGMKLGVSKHTLRCEQTDCTLKAISKPKGLAKLLLNESSEETIKLQQTDNQLTWLSYQKDYGKDLSNPKEFKTETYYLNDQIPAEIVNPDKQLSWPVKAQVYDSISLAYAVQFNVLNEKPLNALYLQDRKRQQPLLLKEAFTEKSLKLDNGHVIPKSELFQFETQQAKVKVWLLPKHDYFPARIEVYNIKKDKTLTLVLQEPPKTL